MRKIIITGLSLIACNAFAYTRDLYSVHFNQTKCALTQHYNLGVCIKNNTGDILNEDNFKIGFSYETQGSGGGCHVETPALLPGLYTNIETSRLILTKGDQGSQRVTANFNFSQINFLGEFKIHSCEFGWYYLTPPSTKPVQMIIEKKDGEYYCVFKPEQ